MLAVVQLVEVRLAEEQLVLVQLQEEQQPEVLVEQVRVVTQRLWALASVEAWAALHVVAHDQAMAFH